MHTFPIDLPTPYTAVSYYWGKGPSSKEIYLNGRTFAIRSNLWSCLHYLSLYFHQQEHYDDWQYIWVDAICINQADATERNHQVRMMDIIFSNAVEVTAWLGLQGIPHYLTWREDAITTIDNDMWLPDNNIAELASRPYWSRMWIVQELLLARNIRFFVSGTSFDFFHLTDFVERQESRVGEDLQRVLKYVRGREIHSRFCRTLYGLLLEFRPCQCQDPRDNVFALLSLLHPREREPLDEVFPDYSLTHEAVVAITLHYLRLHSQQAINADSKDLFDSLGVVQSRKVRQRLIAASSVSQLYAGLDLGNDVKILDLPDYFDDSRGDTGQPKTQLTTRRVFRNLMLFMAVEGFLDWLTQRRFIWNGRLRDSWTAVSNPLYLYSQEGARLLRLDRLYATHILRLRQRICRGLQPQYEADAMEQRPAST